MLLYLQEKRGLFDDWYGPASEARERIRKPGEIPIGPRFSARSHDAAFDQLDAMLKPYTLVPGYHCTRLTEREIACIREAGMQPPNLQILSNRIVALKEERLIDDTVAAALLVENEADQQNRSGKIWFCFYPPRHAGEGGIGRFFKYWGGEALYNSHQEHALRGPILEKIGTPCLIEAEIPIASLGHRSMLATIIVRRYFVNRGWDTNESMNYESFAVESIPACSITRVIKYPHADFIGLSGCDTWRLAPA